MKRLFSAITIAAVASAFIIFPSHNNAFASSYCDGSNQTQYTQSQSGNGTINGFYTWLFQISQWKQPVLESTMNQDDTSTKAASANTVNTDQQASNNAAKAQPEKANVTAPTAANNQKASSLSADEQQMVQLINEERGKAGVAPLQVDADLAKVARIKAQDMVDNNYFSHDSPTYGSPFDMMKSFGIHYTMAGENIAKNGSVLKAHVALMNSEGHRQNILNANYTHVGIGIVTDKNGFVTISQMFIKK